MSNTFKYEEYKPGEAVSQAQALLQQQLAQKPGAYQSQWQTQLDDAINKILNREKFSYDLNGDALYQQYKNQYTMQGQKAMMDTMGQAAALTGGYGNSYAQTAGQQAYQGHLQQLNDKIPELYNLALSKYQMDGQDMYDKYSLLAGQEEQDYGRYQDQLGNWQTETNRLQDRYDTERNFDYGKWSDGRDFAYGQYSDDRGYEYQQGRDKVSDQQWQAEFDEAVRQWNHANGIGTSTGGSTGSSGGSGSSGGGTGGGSGGGGGTGYDNGNLSDAEIRALQKELGVTVDGKWGPASQAAAKAKWGVTSANEANQKYKAGGTDNMVTYSDVAETAAELRKKGATKNDIYQYISSMVNSSNYKPTSSIAQDLAELKAGYVGSGR